MVSGLIGLLESLVSTGCERLWLAVPFAAVDVLYTSNNRTHSHDGDLRGQKYVIRGGTCWAYVDRPRLGSGKNKLLWSLLKEGKQREIKQR